MKKWSEFLEGRCWPGYKPKPGKKAFSPGSCMKESAAAAVAAAIAISKKKSGNYDKEGFRKTTYKNPDHPNRKSNTERESELKEDLRNWFSKTNPKGDWKRINSKGEAIGPCAREPGEPKPKCMSQAQRASLSKKERASAVRRKRQQDPNAERQGAPINVKSKVNENMKQLDEKNKPTNLNYGQEQLLKQNLNLMYIHLPMLMVGHQNGIKAKVVDGSLLMKPKMSKSMAMKVIWL